jgi:rhodanese-related sulfurtransferase
MKTTILKAFVIAAVASWAGLLAAQFRPLQATLRAGDPPPAPEAEPKHPGADDVDEAIDEEESGKGEPVQEAVWPPPPGTIEIDVATAKLAWDMGAAEFIDSRYAEEFERAHILGSWHVPQSAFVNAAPTEFLRFVGPETPLIVYCEGGDCDTSHNVAMRLQSDYNFQWVYVLKPGLPGWALAGHPLDGADPQGFVAETETYEDERR